MTTRMAWSCMRCSSNFTHFNTFMKQLLISIFPLACYKSFWVSPYYLNIDVWKNLDLAWSRFLVFSTLFCCVGFIYKTRVELLVSCLASRTSIRWSFHFLILSYLQICISTISIHVFGYMQHGIDALPGMTIVSACLETVSLQYLAIL